MHSDDVVSKSNKLTLCGDHVLWGGREVEHISGSAKDTYDWDKLIQKCEHLEELGVPVHSGTVVWFGPWFDSVAPGARYMDLLRLCPGLWEHGMLEPRRSALVEANCPWRRLQEPSGSVYFTKDDIIVEWDGEDLVASIMEPDNRYHALADADIHTAQCGQPYGLGPCYADYSMVSGWLDSHGVTPRLATDIARLLREG